MSRKTSKPSQQSSTIKKILTKTVKGQWNQQEKKYAERELKKIYSQEFSKLMNDRKYEMLFERNKSSIDEEFASQTNSRIKNMNKMQEKSTERRTRILKDRIKLYQNNDKKWCYKTESIKEKFKAEDKIMVKNAEEYRRHWQQDIKQRQFQNMIKKKMHSKRSYTDFNSAGMSPVKNEMFNQSKYKELVKRRQSKFQNTRKTKSIQSDLEIHQRREHVLTESRENLQYSKMYSKLKRMNGIDLKREKIKTESIERAKKILNYRRSHTPKSQVGEPCPKFTVKQQSTRLKTEQGRSNSKLGQSYMQYSAFRASNWGDDQKREAFKKNQQNLLQYSQKVKRLKLNKLLKATVRSQLNSQFKKDHLKSYLS